MKPILGGLGPAIAYLEPKLADLADLAMVGVIVVSLTLAVVMQSFVLTGHLLAGSLVGFALCYLITSRSLRGREELGVNRLFISLCAMVSSIWFFELVYHYYGWDQWYSVGEDIFALSLNTTSKSFPLLWGLIVASLVLAGVRYMGATRWFLLTLALSIATMEIWKAIGFPSYFHPEWWPSGTSMLPLIPADYAAATTEEARATISFWGGFFNTLAKIVWCSLPATLFLTRENLGGTLGSRLSRPWPALRRLLMPWQDWRGQGAVPASRHPVETSRRGEGR